MAHSLPMRPDVPVERGRGTRQASLRGGNGGVRSVSVTAWAGLIDLTSLADLTVTC
jgi:hypothetical protein